MAARKLARAPLPPQQQQQQRLRNGQDEIASTMNFGIESSSDGGSEVTDAVVQLRRQNEFSARGAVTDVQQTRPSQLQQQQQQQQPVRLRRTAYLPNKAPPPPPPPPPQPQIQPTGPHQGPDQQRPSSTIVHQTVYTRSREPATISRLTNPFAPTPRPNSQQVWAGNNGGNLSHRSSGSRQSLNSFGGGGGGGGSGNHSGHTLKGRLSNLFRRKSRKPLPQQQQQQQQWAGNQTLWQQQQQQQQRQRRHSGGSAPAGANMNGQGQHQQQLQLASRKNLHTFTYTDAKIYNPNNAVHFAAPLTQTPRLTSPPSTPGVRGMKSPAPPPPLTTSSHVNNAVDDQSVDDQATSSRNPVWWNMRTMGATRSAYSTDVLLVKNAEPAPDYETETTRF